MVEVRVGSGYSRIGAIIEVKIRIDGCDLTELVEGAVEFVGSALGDLVDDAADGVSEARVGIKRPDGDLLDGVLGRRVGEGAKQGEVGRAVEEDFADLVGRAADGPGVSGVIIKRVNDLGCSGSNDAGG